MCCSRNILYFALFTVLLLMSRNVRATNDCSKKLNICNCSNAMIDYVHV